MCELVWYVIILPFLVNQEFFVSFPAIDEAFSAEWSCDTLKFVSETHWKELTEVVVVCPKLFQRKWFM